MTKRTHSYARVHGPFPQASMDYSPFARSVKGPWFISTVILSLRSPERSRRVEGCSRCTNMGDFGKKMLNMTKRTHFRSDAAHPSTPSSKWDYVRSGWRISQKKRQRKNRCRFYFDLSLSLSSEKQYLLENIIRLLQHYHAVSRASDRKLTIRIIIFCSSHITASVCFSQFQSTA